ncbi:ABC transporter substrate-binding protein [Cohnella thailandensis]|uniref:ABC transporter substrate-binding protein n=1 Tax=Cohnella thailandensis TaxID=557557 RepID=A0A841SKG0_9BACL|nr:ABC transporter substrate-binding protein [Cohnella thailandensis]MBB6633003.1 ABC transporter substrate-binding protein [Cohnella thailandensis]MBP1975302.1 peptide/nickel transport system substrate-binding protein [Cohnella thailandensis]
MRARGSKKVSLAILIIAVLTILSACSGNNNASTNAEGSASQPAAGGKKTVNIGVTYAPSGINPLAPVGLVSTYVAGLMYPPLMEIDSDLTYKPMLADSIETTDNATFTVKLNENAKWTDGTPVTADDVIYTLKLMSNPAIASNFAYIFASLEGLDDAGYLPEGQSEISGVAKVDDHTLTMKTKAPTTLDIFKDTIGRNLMTLPQAALKDIAPEDLNKSDFMQKPTVTSGPYKLVDIDRDHYVTMEANKDYFRGAPKIEQLNFKVLQGTAIAAQLQSGEIDMNIPSAGVIPIEDYEKVQGLGNVTTTEGTPLATQYMYINEKVVPDAKQRQAISYAMNRELIVEKLLKGAGEAVDGYFNSTSPYLSENIKPVGYDPEKAKSLLQESGWDSGKQLTMSVLSGDATLEQAAQIIAENLNAVGVKVNIQMLDLGTLLDKLVRMEYDLGILTVSLTPINPLPDIAYFLNEGNPNGYKNAEAEKLIASIGAEVDEAKIKESYGKLQEIIAQDVPMPSIYATKALGAVNNRVTGATPKDFGMFINVYEWDIK